MLALGPDRPIRPNVNFLHVSHLASANLISLFNPDKIVFGGGVFGPATQFLEAIEMEARRWAQPVAMKQVKFCASQLEGDAALHGAAYLALRATQRTG